MTKPRFITFTGFDDATPVHEMHLLSEQYPIEWGVLFSPKRQGTGRYPSLPAVRHLLQNRGDLRLAAHLCGGHSNRLLAQWTLDPILHQPVVKFDRVQVNTSDQFASATLLGAWGVKHGVRPILQYREGLPPVQIGVDWLFDQSGGRGTEPKAWPKPRSDWQSGAVLKGYAGGLNPENVAAHVAEIGAHDQRFWIDMESGVRDEKDLFSVRKCRQVCEAVYGG